VSPAIATRSWALRVLGPASFGDVTVLVAAFREKEKKTKELAAKIREIFEPIRIKSFSRFFGSFEPIFDFKIRGQYRYCIWPPNFTSKSGQKNPKTRRKILFG